MSGAIKKFFSLFIYILPISSIYLYIIKGPHVSFLIWLTASFFLSLVMTASYFALKWMMRDRPKNKDRS